MTVKVKKKVSKKIVKPQPIGILVEGTKKSLEQMAKSIVTVLDSVHKNEFGEQVACSAMCTLAKAVEVSVTNVVQDCTVSINKEE